MNIIRGKIYGVAIMVEHGGLGLSEFDTVEETINNGDIVKEVPCAGFEVLPSYIKKTYTYAL